MAARSINLLKNVFEISEKAEKPKNNLMKQFKKWLFAAIFLSDLKISGTTDIL